MTQTAQYERQDATLDEPPPDSPYVLRFLTGFADTLELLGGFESAGNYTHQGSFAGECPTFNEWNGLSKGALKATNFKVRLHVSDPLTGAPRHRIEVEFGDSPLGIFPYTVEHTGSSDEIEQGIRDDIEYLKSLGFSSIEY